MNRLWVFLGTFFFLTGVQAQSFPGKPLRIIVPFPAGKPEDVDAMLARELERWTKLVQATGMKIE